MDWKNDLLYGMETGDENDENRIYVNLDYGILERYETPKMNFIKVKSLSTNFDTNIQNVLIFMTVHIPINMRKQGIFSEILTFLEDRAKRDKQYLWIGPLMSDDSQWIGHTCKKRGYEFQMPFGWITSFV